jgi:hypothetical protein
MRGQGSDINKIWSLTVGQLRGVQKRLKGNMGFWFGQWST